ncbi:ABC transporter substrate-binding protein [Nakamurella sp. PAMC28650]|uniref:ABC transporter substrate-binding protein n=1 Tax=Nakamurella sp. PAMC28650 TaxID=2762325 RepID=UPI00164CF414|nr:ABC transporter substrate-binding protein [Nakamurella sp. PAMC28650]QNK81563.1 ABC transporter substrate-binding protein [Nakamurella sp. PAMC28650]
MLSSSAAGATGSATAPTDTGKDLIWALSNTPRTLFAPTNYSTDSNLVMSLVQGQLLTFGTKGQLLPAVASSFKSVSATEFQYTIGAGHKFSDGNPVTAEDVAYSLNLQLDPKVASQEASLMSNVKSVTAAGSVVTVTLSQPDALWQFLPASLTGYVWERKSVSASLSSYGTPQTLPVGSGPYKVSEFVPDSHITLVRNPYYTGAQTPFDKITFQIIPDDQTRLLALQSGNIQGTFDVPASAFKQWSAAATVQSIPALVWRGLTMDMTQAPFNDIHVRRALYYATDRAGITAGLTPGLATVSSTINQPAIFAAALDQPTIDAGYKSVATYDFDVNKAKAELAQSSMPSGFTTTLNVPSDSPTVVKIAQVLVQDWAQIGVTLKLNLMAGGPRFQVILDHKPNLGVQIIGNSPDAPDPVELVQQYFSSAQAVKNGNNSSNLKDPAVDALIDKAQSATDVKSAATYALQAQALASQQVPIIPISWGDQAMAVKKGWTADAPGAFFSTSMWLNVIHPN